MNRHRTARRRTWTPEVQPLEGRQLMASNFAGAAGGTIRFREVGTGDNATLYINGTNRADQIHIEDNGTGRAGNITVTTGDGRSYTTRKAVAVVQVSGRKGNDQVSYNLNGPLIAPRSVLGYLGEGDDTFTATIAQPVQTSKLLAIPVYGDAGNDVIRVDQQGAVTAGTVFPFLDGGSGDDLISYSLIGPVESGATVGPGLLGGAGNDIIGLSYAGKVNGQLLYYATIDAGDGNDQVSTAIAVARDSTGQIGTNATTQGIVQGGAGDDTINYLVAVDSPTTASKIYAIAVGGDGRDTVRRSANVTGDSTSEIDAVVS